MPVSPTFVAASMPMSGKRRARGCPSSALRSRNANRMKRLKRLRTDASCKRATQSTSDPGPAQTLRTAAKLFARLSRRRFPGQRLDPSLSSFAPSSSTTSVLTVGMLRMAAACDSLVSARRILVVLARCWRRSRSRNSGVRRQRAATIGYRWSCIQVAGSYWFIQWVSFSVR